jgi:tRNA dimethylallyltransferase
MFAFQSILHPLTAGQFTQKVLQLLAELSRDHAFCVMVGGSGFYIQSLISGMYKAPPGDPGLQQQLRELASTQMGLNELWLEVVQKDPATAKKLHPNDSYRICRAVEIMRTTGKPLSQIQEEKPTEPQFPYPFKQFVLQIEKEALQKRVFDRTEIFFKAGWIDEVLAIKKLYGLELSAMRSVGYLQIVRWLQAVDFELSRVDQEALKSEVVQATMKLAKKQKTWFQKDWHSQLMRFHYQNQNEILKTIVDWVGNKLQK